ncbi:uncharacterized protein LOC128202087 [Galleria mellonella]|uniref:Uncharacterized protein LOC128202087 n=1 Tax=Galleria mellonella TaxID=7137 RepID=A0ABM3N0I9_GALME|nr:uncharacterized protein LOC128202087 [Galleria mellonella]
MTTGGSGAVFFLGTRAHYQVLQQPESRACDVENGNASTETIYQNPSVQTWSEQTERENNGYSADRGNWSYCEQTDATDEKLDIGNGVKRRTRRRPSETALCERDADMRPALLNSVGDNVTPKSKTRRRISPLSFLASLARRKRRMDTEQIQYLQRLENVLANCSYRESCRCLECQSRYFDCDESEGYTSDESDVSPRYVAQPAAQPVEQYHEEDDDDEVFIDTVPGDNTSTDLLIEGKEKMSVSSEEAEEPLDEGMQLEVAAGTPVLLNYLLTHPITCSIQ